VLIVQPDRILRASFSLAYQAYGWHVLDTASGEAAMGLLQALMRPIQELVIGNVIAGQLTRSDVVTAVLRLSPSVRITAIPSLTNPAPVCGNS
jgi:hypothetical protein